MKKLIVLLMLFFTSGIALAQSFSPAKQLEKEYCSPLFSSTEGTVISFLDDHNSNTVLGHINILDWLQGRVAGLQVYRYHTARIPVIRNAVAAVFLNEIRMDASVLENIPVTDIALVKVIRNPFGLGGASGAIAVYTKKGLEEEES